MDLLWLKILATIFISFSGLTMAMKNTVILDSEKDMAIWSIYGLLWRGLVVTTIWVL